MKKHLSIKELAKALGITPAAVRKYEGKGLVNPQRNPDNQYREYDNYEVFWLLHCKCIQRRGFSLNETNEMVNKSQLGEISELIQNKKHEAYMEILRLKEQIEALESWQNKLDHVCLEECTIEYMPPIYYYEMLEMSNFTMDSAEYDVITAVLQSSRCSISVRFPKEAVLEGTDLHYTGLLEYVAANRKCGLEQIEGSGKIEPRLCVTVCMYGTRRQLVTAKRFEKALAYIDGIGAKLTGDVFGEVLMFHYVDNQPHYLHKFYLPIE